MNTASQQRAIESNAPGLALVAGPGSGKTHVVVEKIFHLIDKKGVSPEKILVVTFTEKAAEELQARVRKRTDKSRPQTPWIGTIHAFAAFMLSRFAPAKPEASPQTRGRIPILPRTPIGQTSPQNAEMLQRKNLRKLSTLSRDFKVLDASLSQLERLKTLHKGLLDLLEKRDEEALTFIQKYGFHRTLKLSLELLRAPRKPNFVKELEKAYQAQKRSKNFLDFQDLEFFLLELLRAPEMRLKIQSLFDWIFVDEYQDTNFVQYEIFSKIYVPSKNHLVIVGDPRQSIYRFRGAQPSLFDETTRRILEAGGERIFLNENFRSEEPLVDFLNDLQRKLFDNYPDLVPTKKEKSLLSLDGAVFPLILKRSTTAQDRREEETKTIVEKIQDLLKSGYQPGEIALLFRTRKGFSSFEKELKSSNIAHHTYSGKSLFEQKEALCLLYYLKKCAAPGDDNPEKALIDLFLAHSPLKDIELIDPRLEVGIFLQEVFKKIKNHFPHSPSEPVLQAFEKLTGQLLELGVASPSELIETLEMLREEKNSQMIPPGPRNPSAVSLMTIHAAKGLEFRVVFLCDIAARTLNPERLFLCDEEGEPVFRESAISDRGLKSKLEKTSIFENLEEKEKKEELEESKRLLYVAVSRAKERLFFSLPEEDKKTTSHWISWLKNLGGS